MSEFFRKASFYRFGSGFMADSIRVFHTNDLSRDVEISQKRMRVLV